MAEVLNLGLGAGTNSSEVFNLNTPNPFAISQDYMNKAIAMREKSLARDVANEKERQERLDDFLSKVDNIDPKWANANLELNNLINSYGDQIAEYRAQGKPLTKEFYKGINEAQRAIKNRASINEKNFTKYSQIMAEMSAHPELYSREDIDAFEAEVSGAYEKEDGGIEAAEPILNSWQKKIGPINVVDSYVDGNFLPQSKDKTGYLKATDEKEFKSSVNSYWNSLTMPEKKKIYEQYVRDGRIDADKTLGVEGTEDQKEMIRLIEEDVRPKMEYDKTPVSYSGGGGGGGSKTESQFNIGAQSEPGALSFDTMQKVSISSSKGGNVPPNTFHDQYGEHYMTPNKIVYLSNPSDGIPGWFIVGKIQKEAGSKAIEPGEDEQAVIKPFAAQNGGSYQDYTAKKEGNQWKFYKLEDKWVPYEDNIAVMKGYGINSLEEVAAQQGFKNLAGSSRRQGKAEEPKTTQTAPQTNQQKPTTPTGGGAFKGGIVL
jgi:hypothetical protein